MTGNRVMVMGRIRQNHMVEKDWRLTGEQVVMMMRPLDEKVLGALVGVAVGDALGMPAELFPPEKIEEIYGTIDDFVKPSDENPITAGFQKGQVTDDTWQTIVVAKSIIRNKGRIVPGDIARSIIAWAEEEQRKGRKFIGPSTQKAFEAIKKGEPLERTGKDGVTNGGAMRIVPVGIISYHAGDEQLMDNVALACMPTHHTDVAISAAAAVAKAVSCGIRGKTGVKEIIQASISTAEQAKKKGYQTISPSVAKRAELALKIVDAAQNEQQALRELYDVIGTGFAAAESIPTALALVYLSQGDPVKCAKLAANIGGDTDTIGAVGCGICGAIQGIRAFPRSYVELIEKVNKINFADLAAGLLNAM